MGLTLDLARAHFQASPPFIFSFSRDKQPTLRRGRRDQRARGRGRCSRCLGLHLHLDAHGDGHAATGRGGGANLADKGSPASGGALNRADEFLTPAALVAHQADVLGPRKVERHGRGRAPRACRGGPGDLHFVRGARDFAKARHFFHPLCCAGQGEREKGGAEQSRAEQSRAEQSRAEKTDRSEQSRAEQSRAEQNRAEQSTAEQREP